MGRPRLELLREEDSARIHDVLSKFRLPVVQRWKYLVLTFPWTQWKPPWSHLLPLVSFQWPSHTPHRMKSWISNRIPEQTCSDEEYQPQCGSSFLEQECTLRMRYLWSCDIEDSGTETARRLDCMKCENNEFLVKKVTLRPDGSSISYLSFPQRQLPFMLLRYAMTEISFWLKYYRDVEMRKISTMQGENLGKRFRRLPKDILFPRWGWKLMAFAYI